MGSPQFREATGHRLPRLQIDRGRAGGHIPSAVVIVAGEGTEHVGGGIVLRDRIQASDHVVKGL